MLPVLRKVTKSLTFKVQDDKKLWKQKKFNKFKKTWEHQQYFVQRGQESVPHRRRSPGVPNHPKMAPMVIFVSPKPFLVFATLSLYIVFCSVFVQSPPRQPWRRRWHPGSYWCPSPPTPGFWFCDVRRRQTFKKTDENRHHFSFQTETWENRRP